MIFFYNRNKDVHAHNVIVGKVTTSIAMTRRENNQLKYYKKLLALFQRRDLHPSLVDRLLPQAHLVVTSGDGQHVARDGPADTPHGRLELPQQRRLPAVLRLTPYIHSLVLRAARKHAVGERGAGREGHVPHPVGMRSGTRARLLYPAPRARCAATTGSRVLCAFPHSHDVIT